MSKIQHYANLVRSDASDWAHTDPRARFQLELCDAAERLAEDHEELVEALGDAIGVIQWMSGSNDFSPEGVAHEGWGKARQTLQAITATHAKAEGKT
jgi:hypothetical protein